jgi:hypothetical protein
MRFRFVSGIMVLALVACGLPQHRPPGGASNRDLITAEDISETSAYTAYEAVQRLQPQWLTARGNVSMGADEESTVRNDGVAVPHVILNGIQVGTVEYLRDVLAEHVAELRYYEPGEAGARFGMGHPRGVVVLTLR